MSRRPRPSTLQPWPVAFDPRYELDWGQREYGARLLSEHLDQSHDGASRRTRLIDAHVRRLQQVLPGPPARVLDAACGPGLYAVRLARAGYDVTGVDVNVAALRHARTSARSARLAGRTRFVRADLRELGSALSGFDAALLIYHVLEAFPRAEQVKVLRRLRRALRPGGLLIVEMRLRPDQLPGRLEWWEVASRSLLADRRHLLLGDSTYDRRSNTYVMREVAVFDDGRVAVQHTSAWLCPFDSIPRLFARGGLTVERICDGWTGMLATQLSETCVVVARRR